MEATIKLTKRMLDKSEINANKTVQQFLYDDFGLEYTDQFFTKGSKFTVFGEYTDGEEVYVNFFRRSGRGDKMLSIQKLKKYADVGDEVNLSSDSESDGDGTHIYIEVNRSEKADAA
tara:strand:+ start:1067 stop:1417 length:351 start_codon:yes stop_codon:yes gene_type:complete